MNEIIDHADNPVREWGYASPEFSYPECKRDWFHGGLFGGLFLGNCSCTDCIPPPLPGRF